MARIQLKSEMAGVVWSIEVQAGARIERGNVLMVLESMKMEVPVISELSGLVVELHVNHGDIVEEGQVLGILDY